MAESLKSILQQGNAAISAGNNEGFLLLCTDDTTWNFIGERTLKGKEAVRQWMKEAYAEPPTFEVASLIEEGDFLTAVGNIKMKDEHGDEANYEYCDVWRFRDRKIVELKAFVIKAEVAGAD